MPVQISCIRAPFMQGHFMGFPSGKTILSLVFVLLGIRLWVSVASAAEVINYDEGLGQVRQHIESDSFDKAEHLLKQMLLQYPDNPELLSMLGRLHFWQKEYEESIKIYERLLVIEPSDRNAAELKRVLSAREFNEVDELIDGGRLREAEARLKMLYASAETRYDAGYRLGMLYIRQRDYEKTLDVFREMKNIYPDSIDMQALYIEALILKGEIKEARQTLYNLPEDGRKRLSDTRDDLFYRVRRNYLKVDGRFFNYTLGIEDEEAYSAVLMQRIAEMTFVARYSHVNRFGVEDDEVGLEVYSRLGEKTKRWGYISLTGAPDADVLPEWTMGGAVYQGYGNFDVSLGYTFMQFNDSTVHLIKPGVIAYLPYGFALNETLFIDPERDTLALDSKLHYEPGHRFNGFYSFSFGKAAVEVESLQDVEKIDKYSHTAGAEYRMSPEWSIGLGYQFSHRDGSYDKEGFEFFSRYWW